MISNMLLHDLANYIRYSVADVLNFDDKDRYIFADMDSIAVTLAEEFGEEFFIEKNKAACEEAVSTGRLDFTLEKDGERLRILKKPANEVILILMEKKNEGLEGFPKAS